MKLDIDIKKVKIASLIAVVVTIPTKWINLNSYSIIFLVLISLIEIFVYKRRIQYNIRDLLIFISYFLLTIFSLLYSSNFEPLFSKIETRLAILVFPLVFMGTFEVDKKLLKVVFKYFATSTIFISLLCVINTFVTNYGEGIVYDPTKNWLFSSDSLVEQFGFHPSYFSVYCAFSVFIVLFLYKEGDLRGWFTFLLVVYLSVVLLLLASRVGILSYITIFGVTIFYESYVRKRLVYGIVGFLIFFASMLILGINSQTVRDKFDALLNRNIHQYNEPFRVNRRVIQWNSAIEVFSKSPVIGVGAGDMQDELQKIYLREDFREGYELHYNPHNLFLDSAASLGLLGVMSNLLLFGVSFYQSYSKRNVLYLQFLVLFLLISLVESTFSMQKGIVFFFFFNSIFYSYLSVDCGLAKKEVNPYPPLNLKINDQRRTYCTLRYL